MKEIGIIYEKQYNQKFMKFKKELLALNNSIFCQIVEISKSYMFVCAMNDDVWQKNKIKFYNFVSNIILHNLKQNYIKNNIYNFNRNNLKDRILLSCLKNYDNEFEKQEIFKFLCFENDINVKSFAYFKLNFLIQKWQDMCNITNENSGIISSDEMLYNLIRFLQSKSEIKTDKLKIKFTAHGNVLLILENGENINFRLKDFLLYAVNINPQHLITLNDIPNSGFCENYVNIFKNIFSKKIIKCY